jgi:hypothetical protein
LLAAVLVMRCLAPNKSASNQEKLSGGKEAGFAGKIPFAV